MSKSNVHDSTKEIIVSRDLFLSLSTADQQGIVTHLFASADKRFQDEVSESGEITRITEVTIFSSEALFESLMQIGLPTSVAIRIPFEIIPLLATIKRDQQRTVTTRDIRVAVVQALQDLEPTGQFSRETLAMWSAAYIRRYGNPASQFVKVVDNAAEIDLNYEYIRKILLPHLINRILGLPKTAEPSILYSRVFTNAVIAGMSQEIISAVNTLNLYSIRYKTLLNLLQDLVLEPPHPWMVSEETIDRIVDYNLERTRHHYERLKSDKISANQALFRQRQSAEECFRHLCATILAHYGAFLGVGSRYGLHELRRILNLRNSSQSLWKFCRIREIEADLRAMGSGIDALTNCLARVQASLAYPAIDSHTLTSWISNARILLDIARTLTQQRRNSAAKSQADRTRLPIVQIRLTLSINFEDYSDESESTLLSSLKDCLEYPGHIHVVRREPGSTRITVELTPYQADQLLWMLRRNLLAPLGVTDVEILKNAVEDAIFVHRSVEQRYQVFLCHNFSDKDEVKRIGRRLALNRVLPWLDEWDLPAGTSWRRALEEQIVHIPVAAVFVGAGGIGPWQNVEIDALLHQFVDRGRPVIPVVLRSCNTTPDLPLFLRQFMWVDFRKNRPKPFQQLCEAVQRWCEPNT